jgi:hypothetical protein
MFGQFLLNTNEMLQYVTVAKCQLWMSKVGHLNKAHMSHRMFGTCVKKIIIQIVITLRDESFKPK